MRTTKYICDACGEEMPFADLNPRYAVNPELFLRILPMKQVVSKTQTAMGIVDWEDADVCESCMRTAFKIWRRAS